MVCTLEIKSNQIFTITAEFGPVPAAPAAQAQASGATPPAGGSSSDGPAWMRGPRAPMIPHSFPDTCDWQLIRGSNSQPKPAVCNPAQQGDMVAEA